VVVYVDYEGVDEDYENFVVDYFTRMW